MISGIIGLFLFLFVGTICLILFAFWIWMLIDAIQNKGLTDGEKNRLGAGRCFPAFHRRVAVFFYWPSEAEHMKYKTAAFR